MGSICPFWNVCVDHELWGEPLSLHDVSIGIDVSISIYEL
jgi:hypothetical protein